MMLDFVSLSENCQGAIQTLSTEQQGLHMNSTVSPFNATKRIDGKGCADQIIASIADRVATLGIQPGLAVILVGADSASQTYVNSKSKRAKECGFHSAQYDLPEDTSEVALLELIEQLNVDDQIHGILVQLPLPDQIDPEKVIQAIDPTKDVDGFHFNNAGRLQAGALDQALIPCTPLGCLHLIHQELGQDLRGKHVVVVGRSNIVGKPVASLLLQQDCTVTTVHSGTVNPEQICRLADILIVAVGVPQLVKADWVKPGAVVIDVGINYVEDSSGKGRLIGDVHFDAVVEKAAAITPVPGGVGPMTIAMLMQNTLLVAERTL